MPLVVDASVMLAWCFEDEDSEYAERAVGLARNDGAVVPSIWPLEVANGLVIGQRRGRLTDAKVQWLSEILAAFPVTTSDAPPDRAFGPVLGLARSHGLSVYNASYLDLAMREGLPLATLDARLREVAARVGVAVVS